MGRGYACLGSIKMFRGACQRVMPISALGAPCGKANKGMEESSFVSEEIDGAKVANTIQRLDNHPSIPVLPANDTLELR